MGMNVQSGQPDKKGAQPEMNVTPLVDVVLVLLIIFMIITPQLDNKMPVDLPQLNHPDPEAKGNLEPLEITVTSAGAMYQEKEPIADDDALKQLLEKTHKHDPRRKVIIRSDKEARFGAIRPVFKIVRDSGFKGASLLVSKPGGEDKDA